MATLLEVREWMVTIYSRYELYINKIFRFIAALSWLLVVNGQIGYRETLTGTVPTLLVALICTLLPAGGVVVILALLVVVHLYALSLEAALVGGLLLLILMLIYFRFSPDGGMLLLLYPVCSAAGIPYVLPIAGGLLSGPTSGLAAAVGVVLDRFFRFVSSNEASIQSSGIDTDEMITRFQFLIDGVLGDDVMLIRVIAVAAAGVIVYVIRRLALPYAWIIASGAGAVVQLLVLLIGAAAADAQIGVGAAFLGVLVSFGIGVVISFLAFNLDYSRTENTQFEDDDYYYYVKAVPKNIYARPQRTVKTINTHRAPQGGSGARHTAQAHHLREEGAGWTAQQTGQREPETYPEEFTEEYETEEYETETYTEDPESGFTEEYEDPGLMQDAGQNGYAEEFARNEYADNVQNEEYQGELRTEFATYRPAYEADAYEGPGDYRVDMDTDEDDF